MCRPIICVRCITMVTTMVLRHCIIRISDVIAFVCDSFTLTSQTDLVRKRKSSESSSLPTPEFFTFKDENEDEDDEDGEVSVNPIGEFNILFMVLNVC